ncbi:MAG TPA: zinc-ribbon and DUF3426 domain-containing protein [Gammaproteobacteria bacterium]
MLFTRCPDCETTFRVTANALFKAAGKVRCGRCDTVFVADEELGSAMVSTMTEPKLEIRAEAESTDASFFFVDSTGSISTDDPNARTEAGSLDDEIADDIAGTTWLDESEAPTDEAEPADPEESAVEAEAAASSNTELDDEWAKFFAQAPASDNGSGATDELLIATAGLEKANELLDEVSVTVAGDAPDEKRADEVPLEGKIDTVDDELKFGSRLAALAEVAQEPEVPEPKSRAWIASAAILVLLLAGQATHHFRAELATQPVVGPAIEAAYARFGMEIVPRWDLAQYEILDWVAAAEPSGEDVETMKITARIRNNGPAAQPYPNIQLQLKDRWDQTVGSRVFSPREYLPVDHIVSGLMTAGTTIPAELDLIDQVEEAYGFELDVCLDAPSGGIACVADTVFQ